MQQQDWNPSEDELENPLQMAAKGKPGGTSDLDEDEDDMPPSQG